MQRLGERIVQRLKAPRASGKLSALILAVLVTVVIGGCGLATDPATAVPEQWADPPSVTEKARQLYSEREITSAYQDITGFTFAQGYNRALMNPERKTFTAEDLTTGVVGHMTPAMAEAWSDRVGLALSGNADQQDALRVLQFYDWEQPTWKLPDGESFLRQWIRTVEIGATEGSGTTPEQLKVTMIHQATVRYSVNGSEFDLDVAKQISYWLIPNNGDGPAWLIDDYEGLFAVGEDLPVDEGVQTSLPDPTTTPGVPHP